MQVTDDAQYTSMQGLGKLQAPDSHAMYRR